MRVRKLKVADVDYLYNTGIKEDGFAVSQTSHFWPKEALYRWVKTRTDVLLASEEGDKIAGWVLTQVHKPTGSAIITDIYVDPKYRGKGIGSKLLKECLRHLRKKGTRWVYAQIKPENEASMNLFMSSGFNKGYKFVWTEKAI